jgi:ABC-type bacteriocin/lantibiotic exporter with double-glycine peptidase domain
MIESPGIESIARACKTSEGGTTMAEMIGALRSFGLTATGYRLAFSDLVSLPLPAIWLDQKHYLVIEHVEGRMLTIYDPVDNSIKERELPEKGLHTQTLDIIKITRVKQ